MAWSAVWFLLVSNSPANQRWISAEELDYIESSLASNTNSKVLNHFYFDQFFNHGNLKVTHTFSFKPDFHTPPTFNPAICDNLSSRSR